MDDVELLVVGGGVAGSSAALHSCRSGLRTVVMAPEGPMGTLSTIDHIEDFPGLADVSGYDFCPMLQEQAMDAGAEIRMSEVLGIAKDASSWVVNTTEGEIRARAVIAATGTRGAELGVPGEAELTGRGVSHCASCDGPMFSNKTVAVIGGGDSAVQEALTLLANRVQVRVYQLGDALTAQESYLTRLRSSRATEVRYHARVEAILGSDRVSGLRVIDESTGEKAEDAVDGVFVYIGRIPVTGWLADADVLDASGRVLTDATLGTSQAGLFAAGDLRSGSAGQAATAVGDGITAAWAASNYLRDTAF